MATAQSLDHDATPDGPKDGQKAKKETGPGIGPAGGAGAQGGIIGMLTMLLSFLGMGGLGGNQSKETVYVKEGGDSKPETPEGQPVAGPAPGPAIEMGEPGMNPMAARLAAVGINPNLPAFQNFKAALNGNQPVPAMINTPLTGTQERTAPPRNVTQDNARREATRTQLEASDKEEGVTVKIRPDTVQVALSTVKEGDFTVHKVTETDRTGRKLLTQTIPADQKMELNFSENGDGKYAAAGVDFTKFDGNRARYIDVVASKEHGTRTQIDGLTHEVADRMRLVGGDAKGRTQFGLAIQRGVLVEEKLEEKRALNQAMKMQGIEKFWNDKMKEQVKSSTYTGSGQGFTRNDTKGALSKFEMLKSQKADSNAQDAEIAVQEARQEKDLAAKQSAERLAELKAQQAEEEKKLEKKKETAEPRQELQNNSDQKNNSANSGRNSGDSYASNQGIDVAREDIGGFGMPSTPGSSKGTARSGSMGRGGSSSGATVSAT